MVRVQKDYPYISDRAPAPVALKDHVSRISFCLCTCCPYLTDIQYPHTNKDTGRQTYRCKHRDPDKHTHTSNIFHCIYKYQYQYCFFCLLTVSVCPPARTKEDGIWKEMSPESGYILLTTHPPSGCSWRCRNKTNKQLMQSCSVETLML